MTPILGKILAGALAVILAVGAIAWGLDAYHKRRATKDEVQAQVFKGEANATQTQAQAKDKAYADLKAEHEATKADLDRLSLERSALLRKLAAAKQNSGTPSQPDPGTVPTTTPALSDDLASRDAVIAKDAELITAQAKVIEDQKSEIVILTDARDQWKATADLRNRQAMAQEAATEAWKKAVTASRWQGRIEGALAGAALGYLGGRR
jgi:FlaG/FlaF family flagellin (archaellin)